MAEIRELHASIGGLRQRAAEARSLAQSTSRLGRLGRRHGAVHRLVRDVAAACGKQARLELVGQDTEVDRSVLEQVTCSPFR